MGKFLEKQLKNKKAKDQKTEPDKVTYKSQAWLTAQAKGFSDDGAGAGMGQVTLQDKTKVEVKDVVEPTKEDSAYKPGSNHPIAKSKNGGKSNTVRPAGNGGSITQNINGPLAKKIQLKNNADKADEFKDNKVVTSGADANDGFEDTQTSNLKKYPNTGPAGMNSPNGPPGTPMYNNGNDTGLEITLDLPASRPNTPPPGYSSQEKPEAKYKPFFQRNVLHDYDTVTYHFTLSMLSEQGAISAQKHILNGNKDGEPGFNMWDSNSVEKIVIAETASTVLSINDVQIEAVAGPINNGKRLTGAVNFQMTIQQPLNATFTDTLVNAAMALGLPDGLKATYLLDLYFIGRDPDTGEDLRIPDTERQFLIQIIKVEATVDTNGASYLVQAARAGDMGIRSDVYQTDRPLQLTNLEKVSDLVESIAETINLNELDKLAIEKGILDEYYIKLDDFAMKEIGEDKLLDSDTVNNTTVDLVDDVKLDPNKKMFRIPQGTSIDRILEFGLSHSKKLQRLAKGFKESADADSSNAEDVDRYVKHIIHTKVDTVNIGWDILRNDFAREYHYTISLFPTIRPEILPGILNNPNEVQKEKVDEILKGDLSGGKSRGYKAMSKRYDYLFTGLNDKVLRFDIKYNNQFFFALHSYRGIFQKIDDSTKSKIKVTAEILSKFKEQQQKTAGAWKQYLSTKARLLTEDTGSAEQVDSVKGPEWEAFKKERLKLINLYVAGVKDGTFEGDENLAEQLKSIDSLGERGSTGPAGQNTTSRSDVGNVNNRKNYESSGVLDIERKQFAELLDTQDIVEAIDSNSNPFQIMWGAVPDQFRGNFNSDNQTPGKGHFDSVLEASLADFDADLVAMDMDIKGDPFWLESERDTLNPESASYYDGENYLLFRAITSAGEPDPETGVANPNRENKEQMLNGVYAVVTITSSFSGGQFIQNIKGVKEAFITDISKLEKFEEA